MDDIWSLDDGYPEDQYYRDELEAFMRTISAPIGLAWPASSVLEFQYALNHFFASFFRDDPRKTAHFKSAAGHLHRSHLDLMKSNLLAFMLEIEGGKHPSEAYRFGLREAALRVKEHDRLGGTQSRLGIFDDYRELVAEVSQFITRAGIARPTQGPVYKRPVSKGHEYGIDTARLYREWARLEAMEATLSHKRDISNIQAVVISYLHFNLDDALPKYVTVLRLLLLQRMNCAYLAKNPNAGSVFKALIKNKRLQAFWASIENADLGNHPENLDSVKDKIDDLFIGKYRFLEENAASWL